MNQRPLTQENRSCVRGLFPPLPAEPFRSKKGAPKQRAPSVFLPVFSLALWKTGETTAAEPAVELLMNLDNAAPLQLAQPI